MAQRSKKVRSCHLDSFHSHRQSVQSDVGLPFQEFLPRERIAAAVLAAGIVYRDRVYNPIVTLWAFLSQVMGSTRSTCEDAVARVAAERAARGQSQCSSRTTSYCAARKRLSEQLIQQLALDTGRDMDQAAKPEWRWKGHSVKLVDGTTASLADTRGNQAEYPQSSSQKEGLGFPSMRLVMLLSLSVGTAVACAMGPCAGKGTGELSLFRQLWDSLNPQDIVLGDRLYDSYRDIASLLARGVFCVFGMKASRDVDFHRGRQLGPDDHVVVWHKPKYTASRYASREEWEALPDMVEAREVRRIVHRKGFRPTEVAVVTTLLDAELYSADELIGLFGQRWNCELDLRSIKRSLGMHQLKCKTPEMVRKEVWTHLLAYNVIRVRMAQAAAEHGCLPRGLSFTGAQTQMEHFTRLIEIINDPADCERVERAMLTAIAGCLAGERESRQEPRAIKRRKQKYSNLTKPRAQARKELAA